MKNITLLFFLAFSVSVYAQSDFCGFDSLMLSWKHSDPAGYSASKAAHHSNVAAYRATHPYVNYMLTPNSTGGYSLVGGNSCPQVNYILPVVVHIIHLAAHSTPGIGSNIRNSQVDSQLLALNNAYRNAAFTGGLAINTGIQFCLANKKPDSTVAFNGITRTSSTRSITRRTQLDSLIKLIQYPTDRYINIYVVSTILDSVGSDNGILGYATYPYGSNRSKDAIVVRHNWFGIYNGGSQLNSLADGKVLVHEMGHYLGLYHPFEGGCTGLSPTTCQTEGDLCCDVPAVDAERTNCSPYNSCTESPTNLPDQKENYMDYTNPSCKTTFTPDQANIMYSVLENIRPSLWDPNNINTLKLSCCMNNARFSGMDFGCKTDSLYYTAYKYDNATYTWRLYRGTSLLNTYNTTNAKLQIKLDTGHYTLQLQVDAGGRFTYTFPHTIVIVDCSNPIKSTRGTWYFGDLAGVRFYNGGKVLRDLGPYNEKKKTNLNNIDIYEGTVSMSDTAGKLLFYGGPHTTGADLVLYDKNYQKMTGSPAEGDASSAQGMITIQHSKKPYIHYLFHTNNTQTEAFKFSKIDLSQTSSTQGALLNKNTIINDSAGQLLELIGEGITALSGCNDSTYWIFVNRLYPAALLIYQFVNGTLNYHSSFQPFYAFSRDKMRFSPNGTIFSYNNSIYSFDRSNAQIKSLHQDNTISQVYDAVFSADSKLLYRSENTNADPNSFNIYQLDLESKDPNLNKVLISPKLTSRQSMQMGPDGKIYITNLDSKYLSSISNPSNRQYNGNNCGYKDVDIVLGSAGQKILCREGFPNFIDAKDQAVIGADFLSQRIACKTIEFLSNHCCQSTYKWYFGDGDSSSSKNPSHTYADSGTYTVIMKAGALTKSKSIRIGIPKRDLKISGDTLLCQAGIRHYTAKRDSNFVSYLWKPINDSTISTDKNLAIIRWKDSGSLRVVIADKFGCKDSASIIVKKATAITSNTITSNLIVCTPTFNSVLTGSTPAGGGAGTFTYRWLYQSSDSSWHIIDTATKINFRAVNFPYNTRIYREVTKNGCSHLSNTSTITILSQTNKIDLVQQPCFKDSTFIVKGDTTYGTLSTTFEWQRSDNGTDWDYMGITTQNLETIIGNEEYFYVRRLVYYSDYSCEVSSNAIKIVPYLKITSQPQNKYVCSWGTAQFSIAVSNPQNLPLQYYVRYYDSSGSAWDSFRVASLTYSVTTPKYSSTDSIQFAIQTPCGILYSSKALFKIRPSGPHISTLPDDQFIDEGSRTDFVSTVSNPYEAGLTYRWQYRRDIRTYNKLNYFHDSGGWDPKYTDWVYITDSTRNKLAFVTAICDDTTEYRMIANNGCVTASYPARLYVTHKADLWMRDSPDDIGDEPNSHAGSIHNPKERTEKVYMSPDVYNCQNSPGCLSSEDAEFKNFGSNYVQFHIRNRGSQTSKPARLYLYWTMASTGEIWDKSWKTSSLLSWPKPGTSTPYYNDNFNKFYNTDGSSPFNGLTFPLGGQINSTGILIPALDSGQTFDSAYAWQPPNPAWYYTKVNNDKVYQKRLNICLLARIEYCDEYPHKMAFAEFFRTNIDSNVVSNNNIATHNFYVGDENDQNIREENPREIIWTSICHRQPTDPGPVTVFFDASNPYYYSGGRAIITMDDDLYNAWVVGGLLSSGVFPLDSQRFEVTTTNAVFSNLTSDSACLGKMGLEFYPINPYSLPAEVSLFTLSQTSNEGTSYDGGTAFQIQFHDLQGDGGGEGLVASPAKLQEINKQQTGYLVYPNPANTRLTVYIAAAPGTTHTIQLTSLTGQILLTQSIQQSNTQSITKQLDISHLAVGTYFVRLSSDAKTEVRKINILR